jgi:DNA recombination protein RmuC
MLHIYFAIVAVLLLTLIALLVLLRRRRMDDVGPAMQSGFQSLSEGQERVQRAVLDDIGRSRSEVTQNLATLGESLGRTLTGIGSLQKDQLDSFAQQVVALRQGTELSLHALGGTVAEQLKRIQEDNAKQLDQMRATVDEKLQGTLEKRLGESFKQVSERLQQVHEGLGEMRGLAQGVGDLKRVLANVKVRGGWGEVQLGMLLEEMLAPGQFERNVKTREGSDEMVEFAIKLPGREEGGEAAVWLPIDAKFPMEDYQRLVEAQERADTAAVEAAGKQLEASIRASAKDISQKYLNPPKTTDFGIVFLPTEGLYAEVVRRAGLVEAIQRQYRVTFVGPTTFAAFLNSLQMGFRTLAIEKRSSEVWKLLSAVKTEFGKFGEALAGVKKKLDQASGTMDEAARRSRAIERKLRDVQQLPTAEARIVLAEGDQPEDAEPSKE